MSKHECPMCSAVNPSVSRVGSRSQFLLLSIVGAVLTMCLLSGPGAFGYETITHEALSEAALQHPKCIVNGYLKNILGVDGTLGGIPIVTFLRQGAREEDNGSRPLNHFYEPITNSGLLSFSNSLDWAWSNPINGDNWMGSRESFLGWLTADSPYQRLDYAAITIIRLGHMIHLVQDLAQPQHTRLDTHRFEHRYETFCAESYNHLDHILDLGTDRARLPRFNYKLVPVESGIPPEVRAVWDTEQYQGQAGFNTIANFSGAPGLAEYSSCFFVTSDTLFTGQSYAKFPRFLVTLDLGWPDDYPYPRLEQTDIARLDEYSSELHLMRVGNDLSRGWHPIISTKEVPQLATLWLPRPGSKRGEIGLTDDNYRAHAEKLLPKAVTYSAHLLNYFFHGRLQLDSVRKFDGIQKYRIVVNKGGSERFGTGDWALYWDDASGWRQPVKKFDAKEYRYLSGSKQCRLWFPQDPRYADRQFTLVFMGNIGNEERTGIAVQRFGLIANQMEGFGAVDDTKFDLSVYLNPASLGFRSVSPFDNKENKIYLYPHGKARPSVSRKGGELAIRCGGTAWVGNPARHPKPIRLVEGQIEIKAIDDPRAGKDRISVSFKGSDKHGELTWSFSGTVKRNSKGEGGYLSLWGKLQRITKSL